MTHICLCKLTIIGSDNGLWPGQRQAIIWTNAGILLIGPLGTNFSEILIGIQTFSFKKMHLKMASAKWRPFYLSLNVLSVIKTWISNYIHCFIWDVVTHPCSNLTTIEVRAWMSNYVPLFMQISLHIHALISMLVELILVCKRGPRGENFGLYEYFGSKDVEIGIRVLSVCHYIGWLITNGVHGSVGHYWN